MTAISNNWPDDKPAAIAFTFDVDAESGFLGEGEAYAKRLTSLSEGRFGVTRGLPRILNLLQRYGVDATFFVPTRLRRSSSTDTKSGTMAISISAATRSQPMRSARRSRRGWIHFNEQGRLVRLVTALRRGN
jgi:hypothetical protein